MNKKTNLDLFGNPVIDDTEDVYQTKKVMPKDISDKIETEYIIEVICTDEKNQEQIYNELTRKGLSCRVLTL